MEIVEIKNEYIERLRKTFPHVMKCSNIYSKHSRKYVGIILQIKKFSYYAPFSSPKNYDYDLKGLPKKSSPFVLRIIDHDINNKKIIGKIILNCMIPVPNKFIKHFDLKYIRDENYKNLLLSEFKWIQKNIGEITEAALKVYQTKNNKIVLPFRKIEKYIIKRYNL